MRSLINEPLTVHVFAFTSILHHLGSIELIICPNIWHDDSLSTYLRGKESAGHTLVWQFWWVSWYWVLTTEAGLLLKRTDKEFHLESCELLIWMIFTSRTGRLDSRDWVPSRLPKINLKLWGSGVQSSYCSCSHPTTSVGRNMAIKGTVLT